MTSAIKAGLLAAVVLAATCSLAQDSHNATSSGASHVAIGSTSGTHGGTFGPGGRTSTPTPANPSNHGGNSPSHAQPMRRPHYYGYGYGYSPYGASYELPYDSEYDQLPGRGTLDHEQPQEPADNRVGPTVFEHNGRVSSSAADSRYGVVKKQAPSEPAPESVSAPNEIVLVFRDGHQLEVDNYAIAGSNVIVLGEKTEKIAVTDLDLDATAKANHERGVDFKIPHTS